MRLKHGDYSYTWSKTIKDRIAFKIYDDNLKKMRVKSL